MAYRRRIVFRCDAHPEKWNTNSLQKCYRVLKDMNGYECWLARGGLLCDKTDKIVVIYAHLESNEMPLLLKNSMLLLCMLAVLGCKNKAAAPSKDDNPKPKEELTNGLTAAQAAKVVAKVGEETITVGDVTEQINRLSPYIKRRWATPEKRKEFLQKLIQIELLSQEAIRNGLDESPEVQRAVKQVMVRLMVKNDLQDELFPASVDESRLKKEYEKEWLKYHSPEQRRVSQIVLATENEAREIIADIQKSSDPRARFRELARTISIDEAGRNRAGDVGYVTNPKDIAASKENGPGRAFEQAPGVSEAVATATWTLTRPNQLYAEPVKTALGYHVLMLSTVKPALNRSYNSVKRLIENRVLREIKREKMDEFVATLRKKANVKIYQENLDKLKLELPKAGEAAANASQSGDVMELDAPESAASDMVSSDTNAREMSD
ncbi:MAG: peptidylprolyl isomerase [Deltaproteobacteria bacterium]|nr:peptidylprolyl isomerase [Deltaproteobacteria bacterium]